MNHKINDGPRRAADRIFQGEGLKGRGDVHKICLLSRHLPLDYNQDRRPRGSAPTLRLEKVATMMTKCSGLFSPQRRRSMMMLLMSI